MKQRLKLRLLNFTAIYLFFNDLFDLCLYCMQFDLVATDIFLLWSHQNLTFLLCQVTPQSGNIPVN